MTTLTTTDREALLDALYEAKEHLNEAINLVDRYVRYTGDAAAEAYILDQLRILADRDHGFLSNDLNLDDLIESLKEREDADEYDEAEEDEDPNPFSRALNPNWHGGNTLGRFVSIPEDEE